MRTWQFLIPAVLLAHIARAQDCDATDPEWPAEFSVQFLGGFSASTTLGPDADFDYEPFNLRAGTVLIPDHDGPLLPPGDVTCLLDIVIARADNYGSVIAGPSVLLRKDFWRSDSRVTPYAQAGAGMVYTDADNDHSQRVIGRSWEFLLQTGIGCHCRVTDRWTFDVEGNYQHISNARLGSRNLGSNNLGLSLGLTRYFGGPR